MKNFETLTNTCWGLRWYFKLEVNDSMCIDRVDGWTVELLDIKYIKRGFDSAHT